MKVTKPQVATIVGFVMSGLLLIFAASCSFEKQAVDETGRKQAEELPVARQSGEESIAEQVKEEVFVANLFCAACHYGFGDETLALDHERAGIGCERCHGESERHRSDEDNVTPPEIMYPKARINPTCMMCHPRHEIRHVKNHEILLAGAQTIFDDAAGPGIHCTDCHAEDHRINVRTIRWNKVTGELLE